LFAPFYVAWGATTRSSNLSIPVETVTPPCQRTGLEARGTEYEGAGGRGQAQRTAVTPSRDARAAVPWCQKTNGSAGFRRRVGSRAPARWLQTALAPTATAKGTPMKKNKLLKKLGLNAQTIANLSADALGSAAGGDYTDHAGCVDTVPRSFCICPTKAVCSLGGGCR
jgi:hypothetical protein